MIYAPGRGYQGGKRKPAPNPFAHIPSGGELRHREIGGTFVPSIPAAAATAAGLPAQTTRPTPQQQPSAPASASPAASSLIAAVSGLLSPGPSVREIAEAAHTLGVKPLSDSPGKAAQDSGTLKVVAHLPTIRVDSPKVLGTPTALQVARAARQGQTRRNEKGKLTIPATRQAARQLTQARAKMQRSRGGILGITHGPEATRFANALAKYTGLNPRAIGAWVQAEGGGYAAGGEAGKNNWLGVGYPGHPTPFSQSPAFNGTPEQAAKATAQWMEGKIGHEYGYGAAPSIQTIIPTAKGGTSQDFLRALSTSGWGTNVGSVAQNLASISVQPPDQKVLADFKVAAARAKQLGIPTRVAPAGDLERGPGGQIIYVRADAQGMVKWAESALGTQEGTAKQVRWASTFGLGSGPWCANFISNGLQRRGVPLPPNPNFVPSYETEWTGGRNIGTDITRAKPGDLIAYSGDHIALYVGNGEVISGNYGNEVARGPVSGGPAPVSAILRPNYKGGKIAVHESTMLPGSSFPSGAIGVSAPAGAALGESSAAQGGSQRLSVSAGATVPISELLALQSLLAPNQTKEPEHGEGRGTIARILARRRL